VHRAFRIWRAFSAYSPVFPIGRIVASGCVTKLAPEIVAAYDAPFPSRAYKAGARLPGTPATSSCSSVAH